MCAPALPHELNSCDKLTNRPCADLSIDRTAPCNALLLLALRADQRAWPSAYEGIYISPTFPDNPKPMTHYAIINMLRDLDPSYPLPSYKDIKTLPELRQLLRKITAPGLEACLQLLLEDSNPAHCLRAGGLMVMHVCCHMIAAAHADSSLAMYGVQAAFEQAALARLAAAESALQASLLRCCSALLPACPISPQ